MPTPFVAVMKTPYWPGLIVSPPPPWSWMPIAFVVVTLIGPGDGPAGASRTKVPPLTRAALTPLGGISVVVPTTVVVPLWTVTVEVTVPGPTVCAIAVVTVAASSPAESVPPNTDLSAVDASNAGLRARWGCGVGPGWYIARDDRLLTPTPSLRRAPTAYLSIGARSRMPQSLATWRGVRAEPKHLVALEPEADAL
jgi:hypothetical protein